MQLAILVLLIYVIYAEWRVLDLRKKLMAADGSIAKFKKDKTIWYSGVLPKADKLCVFQETGGEYVISKLADKHWVKKDGETDFSKIKRWAYLVDLEGL